VVGPAGRDPCVLGLAGVFVLVAHDLLPGSALGRAKYMVEGVVSIVFVTLVVLLTAVPRARSSSPSR